MKQIQLNFDPELHRYFDENNKTYTSVTQLIQKVEPIFDKKYWSMYTALKNAGHKVRPTNIGKTIWVDGSNRSIDSLYKDPIRFRKVNEVVGNWKDLTDKSIVRGNTIHDHLETSINISKDDKEGATNDLVVPLVNRGFEVFSSKHDLDKTDLKDIFPTIYKRLLEYINLGCTIYAEKKIYNSNYFIAGTIDVLVVKGKMFAILDWKTNKDEMLFHSGYYKKVQVGNEWVKGSQFVNTDDRLLSPLDHLQRCKGVIYTLQLSTYACMMELWGYKLVANGLEIFHIRPDREPKLIKIEYLKQDAIKLLEYNLTLDLNGTKKSTNFGVK